MNYIITYYCRRIFLSCFFYIELIRMQPLKHAPDPGVVKCEFDMCQKWCASVSQENHITRRGPLLLLLLQYPCEGPFPSRSRHNLKYLPRNSSFITLSRGGAVNVANCVSSNQQPLAASSYPRDRSVSSTNLPPVHLSPLFPGRPKRS